MKKIVRTCFTILVALAVTAAVLFMIELWKPAPFEDCADGIYTAETDGYRRHMITQVTIENGNITDIQVIQHYEKGAEYFEEPIREIPRRIIHLQSTDVDVISGSTRTSNGIIHGVEQAIEQAQIVYTEQSVP